MAAGQSSKNYDLQIKVRAGLRAAAAAAAAAAAPAASALDRDRRCRAAPGCSELTCARCAVWLGVCDARRS